MTFLKLDIRADELSAIGACLITEWRSVSGGINDSIVAQVGSGSIIMDPGVADTG